MRRIRFVALALIGFVATLIGSCLTPGTFIHRVLSVATCTIFSFNSTLCAANLARSGDRVVAANPPAVVAQGNACGSGTVTQPTMQRGNDGTMYQVYYDFRRGQETVNSDACGREYWISPNSKHPLYGIRFVYLVNGLRNRVVPTLYYETASGALKVWDNNVAAARLPNPFSPDLGIASNPNASRSQVNQPNSSQPTQQQAKPESNKPTRAGGSMSNLPCNPTLQTSSAQPAKEVIVKGVPTSFTDVEAGVKADGSQIYLPTVARRLDNGDVSVFVPLHPTNGKAGGDVQLAIASGNSICSALSLRIEPLVSSPGSAGSTKRIAAKVETFVNKLIEGSNVSRTELIGNPKSLPQEVLPMSLVVWLLDNPQNPNSLKAILGGTAPILKGQQIDYQLIDSLVANSGLDTVMDNVINTITKKLENRGALTNQVYLAELKALDKGYTSFPLNYRYPSRFTSTAEKQGMEASQSYYLSRLGSSLFNFADCHPRFVSNAEKLNGRNHIYCSWIKSGSLSLNAVSNASIS